jgi:hypothetical protein
MQEKKKTGIWQFKGRTHRTCDCCVPEPFTSFQYTLEVFREGVRMQSRPSRYRVPGYRIWPVLHADGGEWGEGGGRAGKEGGGGSKGEGQLKG